VTPYKGPHPFWVRDHRGKVLGPLTLKDALDVVRAEGQRGNGQRVAIAGQAMHFMPAVTFAKLTGQEALLDREVQGERSGQRRTGDLSKISLPNLFARVARERPTGRLTFQLHAPSGEVTFEIHLVKGQPTFVYADEPSLQLPSLMVAQNLLQENLLPGVMQLVLATDRRLEDVVARESSLDLRPYQAVFMRERLGFLFQNARGHFEMDTQLLPARTEPFAYSLMAVLPDLVYRFMAPNEVAQVVVPLLGMRVRPTELFPTGVRLLRLTSSQTELVERILRAETLGAALPEGKGTRSTYAMTYVMLETGLLRA